MDRIEEILDQGLANMEGLIIKSMKDNDRVASGRTIRSMRREVSTKGNFTTGQITVRGFTSTLETGRGPTKRKTDGKLKDMILQWMRARNIPDEALYPILKTLNKNGWNTSLPNRTNPNGGTKGILSNPIDQGLDDITAAIADAQVDIALQKIDISISKSI